LVQMTSVEKSLFHLVIDILSYLSMEIIE
jgi:hypothetical protein